MAAQSSQRRVEPSHSNEKWIVSYKAWLFCQRHMYFAEEMLELMFGIGFVAGVARTMFDATPNRCRTSGTIFFSTGFTPETFLHESVWPHSKRRLEDNVFFSLLQRSGFAGGVMDSGSELKSGEQSSNCLLTTNTLNGMNPYGLIQLWVKQKDFDLEKL